MKFNLKNRPKLKVFPFKAKEEGERLREAIVKELNRKIENLRLKGDHYHAAKLERFKQVFIEEPNSNFEVLPDGTIRFKPKQP